MKQISKTLIHSCRKQIKITQQIVQKFAKIVGDYNPVHLNQQVASKTRFQQRIAHGMVGLSYLQSMMPFNYTYTNLQIKFQRPIFFQEIINIKLQLFLKQNQLNVMIVKPKNNSKQSTKKQKQTEKVKKIENNISKQSQQTQIVTIATGKWAKQTNL